MIFAYIFLLHPLWWLLGLDQAVMIGIPLVFLLGAALRRRLTVRSSAFGFILGGMVVSIFISGIVSFSEAGASFYFPLYIYRTICYLSGLGTFLLIFGSCRSIDDINKVTRIIVWTVFLSVVITFLALILFKFQSVHYRTLLNWIIPGSVRDMGTVRPWLEKTIIANGELFGVALPRGFGLFVYSNMFAFALETAIPLCVYLAAKNRMYWLIALGMILGMATTLSRGGMLSLIGGSICAVFISRKSKFSLIVVGTTVLTVLILLHYVGYKNVITPQTVLKTSCNVIVEAREDAVKGRKIIYEETLKKIKEKLFFGWGTTRRFADHPNWPYVGSHSTYLYFLMSGGVFGLLFFILFVLNLIRNMFDVNKKHVGDDVLDLRRFRTFCFWIVTAHAVHMTILNIQDDLYVFNITMATWGLIASANEKPLLASGNRY